jgi:streptomycin 6-kinase
MPGPSPRQFCQEQLLMLGDEELLPSAQAATLEILHSTVMKDPDGPTFEARLRVLAAASAEDGSVVGAAAQVAQVLLDAWREAQQEP